VEGVGSERVYNSFGDPLSQDIIVAVIDSGVDVNHEDLQGKIWINDKEIPNNGIDDDFNGYVDDVFGWNFIGGEKGMATMVEDAGLLNGLRLVKGDPAYQTGSDTLEVTREYSRLLALKDAGKDLSEAEEALFKETKAIVLKERRNGLDGYNTYIGLKEKYTKAETVLRKAGLTEITLTTVEAFAPKTSEEVLA